MHLGTQRLCGLVGRKRLPSQAREHSTAPGGPCTEQRATGPVLSHQALQDSARHKLPSPSRTGMCLSVEVAHALASAPYTGCGCGYDVIRYMNTWGLFYDSHGKSEEMGTLPRSVQNWLSPAGDRSVLNLQQYWEAVA